jgi:predicted DNA-binding protein with PD1-like motif
MTFRSFTFVLFFLLGCKTMPAYKTPTVHTFRLKPGADLKQGILNEVKARGIEAGHIGTCVGSLLVLTYTSASAMKREPQLAVI